MPTLALEDPVYLSCLSGNLHLAWTISTQSTGTHQRSSYPVSVKLQKFPPLGLDVATFYFYGKPQFNDVMTLFLHNNDWHIEVAI
jgi:hypothetical protein